MPWHDWQFWVVTIIAIGGCTIMVRVIIPAKRRGSDANTSCPNCTSSSTYRQFKRKVPLTIDRRKP